MEPARPTAWRISLMPRPKAYSPPTSSHTLTRGMSRASGRGVGVFAITTTQVKGTPTSSSPEALEEVVRDLLDALVGAVRPAVVRERRHVPRRRRQPLRPEDGRGVEDDVPLGPGVDRRGVVRLAAAAGPRRPLG